MSTAIQNIPELKGDNILWIMFKLYVCYFRFWNQVDITLIRELNQMWSYKHDFEMLGFDFEKFLSEI